MTRTGDRCSGRNLWSARRILFALNRGRNLRPVLPPITHARSSAGDFFLPRPVQARAACHSQSMRPCCLQWQNRDPPGGYPFPLPPGDVRVSNEARFPFRGIRDALPKSHRLAAAAILSAPSTPFWRGACEANCNFSLGDRDDGRIADSADQPDRHSSRLSKTCSSEARGHNRAPHRDSSPTGVWVPEPQLSVWMVEHELLVSKDIPPWVLRRLLAVGLPARLLRLAVRR